MKNKSALIAVIVFIICSICFNIAAYGGDYDTPIIPIPGSSTSQGGSSEDETGGNWETPPVDVKEPVAISKCSFSGVTNKVYSGKAIKPEPTVKYGKTTNYYKGTKKLTFKINPKGTSVSKVISPKKKKIKITWKKQTTQTTGYQIQYSTNKNFKKGNKTVTVSKNKTTAKTISKLTSKKKYYVRIRTYKTVKGAKYYSGWKKYSKAIKVK